MSHVLESKRIIRPHSSCLSNSPSDGESQLIHRQNQHILQQDLNTISSYNYKHVSRSFSAKHIPNRRPSVSQNQLNYVNSSVLRRSFSAPLKTANMKPSVSQNISDTNRIDNMQSIDCPWVLICADAKKSSDLLQKVSSSHSCLITSDDFEFTFKLQREVDLVLNKIWKVESRLVVLKKLIILKGIQFTKFNDMNVDYNDAKYDFLNNSEFENYICSARVFAENLEQHELELKKLL